MGVNSYDLKARLRPALLVLLPVALTTGLWVELDRWPWWLLGALSAWLGLGYLLGQVARDVGRSREQGLFHAWGGKPTTVALRHAGPTAKPTLAQYHAKLAPLAASGKLPTPHEESEDPAAADEAYDAVIAALRSLTRDTRLVAVESINYAYRRNVWAMKPVGLALCIGAGAASLAVGVMRGGTGLLSPWWVLAAAVLLLGFWRWVVSPDWVHRAAQRYCEALLGATHQLPAPSGAT